MPWRLAVRCNAALVDLRPRVASFPALVDPENVRCTQPIGARLKTEGHPGLATRFARCEGDVYAVLNPNVLSAPIIQSYLTCQIADHGVAISQGPVGNIQPWMRIP